MFDTLKYSITTTAGWVSIIQLAAKGVEYFTPDSIDASIQAVVDPLTALIISLGAVFHLVKAGKDVQAAKA